MLELRQEVRQFLREEPFTARVNSWLTGFSAQFSERLAARGWIGMTWPVRYGGGERSQLERYAVIEELLAAGAPVAAHWFADRQVGPALLHVGTEEQKQRFLPEMARGRCFFSIAMSEPDAGSDLAAIRTRAVPDGDGWRLNGQKIWTTFAHRSHFALVLARTSTEEGARHAGMTQFIVDLAAPGVTVRPIESLDGETHFNEVFFDDVLVDSVLGTVGQGWEQAIAELVNERSGPERFLSVMPLYRELLRDGVPDRDAVVGEVVARLWSARTMSLQVAERLQAGESPGVEAAMVKDLGTALEQDMVELARELGAGGALFTQAVHGAPSFTLRGGASEILRGVVAQGLVR